MECIPPIISHLSNNNISHKNLSQYLYIIYKLTSNSSIVLEQFINKQLFKTILDVMYNYDISVKLTCVRIIANMVSGNDVQTQFMINQGVIEALKNLLEEKDMRVLKEVIWGVSNLTAGAVSQIEGVIKSGIMDKVFELCNGLVDKTFEEVIYYEVRCYKCKLIYYYNILGIKGRHILDSKPYRRGCT